VHDHARVAAALAHTVWRLARLDEAIELAQDAFDVLAADEPDADVAALAAQLGRLQHFAGNPDEAARWTETALDVGEDLRLPAVISSALNTKSLIVRNHRHESEALLRKALAIALDNDLVPEALRAYNNLFVLLSSWDREEEAFALIPDALALARRRGDRFWEVQLITGLVEEGLARGEWEEALRHGAEVAPADQKQDSDLCVTMARIHLERGERDDARRQLSMIVDDVDTNDVQLRNLALWRRRLTAELESRYADAIAAIADCLLDSSDLMPAQSVADALRDAATYATLSGDHAAALEVGAKVDDLSAAIRSRAVEAQLHRLRANAAAHGGDVEAAADAYAIALAHGRSLGFSIWLAPVLFDYGAWLHREGRVEEAAPLLAEARELFERMGAIVWLQRLDALAPAAATSV
jgi:tetratricopeptide (TPR) repeat protein